MFVFITSFNLFGLRYSGTATDPASTVTARYLSDDTFRKTVCVSLAGYFGDKMSQQPNRYLSTQPLHFEDKMSTKGVV